MSYNQDSIKSLDPIAHIRLRMGMYVPDCGIQGLHHLIEEVLNNSIDEYLAGYGNNIIVSYSVNGDKDIIGIQDYGRGIPWGYRKDLGMDSLTAVFMKTLTGGKFENSSYSTSSGQNGVGLTVLTALCEAIQIKSVTNQGTAELSIKDAVPKKIIRSDYNEVTGSIQPLPFTTLSLTR
jgi:DNA gyrase subunit B